MFGRDIKIRGLERKVASAIGIVTKTIDSLEIANKEYEAVKEEVGNEISTLTEVHMDLHHKIGQNNKIIENFKNLLK